jgi:hypothetical protein
MVVVVVVVVVVAAAAAIGGGGGRGVVALIAAADLQAVQPAVDIHAPYMMYIGMCTHAHANISAI